MDDEVHSADFVLEFSLINFDFAHIDRCYLAYLTDCVNSSNLLISQI